MNNIFFPWKKSNVQLTDKKFKTKSKQTAASDVIPQPIWGDVLLFQNLSSQLLFKLGNSISLVKDDKIEVGLPIPCHLKA